MLGSEPLLTVSTADIPVFTLQRLHTLPTSRVTHHAVLIRHTHHTSLGMAAWVHYEAFTKISLTTRPAKVSAAAWMTLPQGMTNSQNIERTLGRQRSPHHRPPMLLSVSYYKLESFN